MSMKIVVTSVFLEDQDKACMYTSSVTMGEKTALSLNTKNKASLKTTVPMFIVKQWNLKAGEELEWALEICKEGELGATVRKTSSVRND